MYDYENDAAVDMKAIDVTNRGIVNGFATLILKETSCYRYFERRDV
jgi:hypothetical protein